MPEHQKEQATVAGFVPTALDGGYKLPDFRKNKVFSIIHVRGLSIQLPITDNTYHGCHPEFSEEIPAGLFIWRESFYLLTKSNIYSCSLQFSYLLHA